MSDAGDSEDELIDYEVVVTRTVMIGDSDDFNGDSDDFNMHENAEQASKWTVAKQPCCYVVASSLCVSPSSSPISSASFSVFERPKAEDLDYRTACTQLRICLL